MRNLDNVRKFYNDMASTDEAIEKAVQLFAGYDLFSGEKIEVDLPFVGKINVFLAVIERDRSEYMDAGNILSAPKADYHKTWVAACFDREVRGSRKSYKHGCWMTEVNSNLFGEPTKYGTSVHVPNETGGGRAGVDWRDYTPAELARKGFEAICNPKNYMPEELHQFPFDEDETVQVFVKDTTKIGGYDFVTKAKDALQEANDKAAMIIRAERGNAITEANIRLGNVNFRLPAFGKNHVWFS